MSFANLEEARKQIDAIDQNLLPLLLERMALCCEIGRYKAANALPVYDAAREESLVSALRSKVDPAYREDAEQVYRLLFALSRKHQREENRNYDE